VDVALRRPGHRSAMSATLNCHVADGAVPVRVTGAAADGARWHGIDLARCQAVQGDLARLRGDARRRPTPAVVRLYRIHVCVK
jgi:hypothetical protein